MSNQSRIPTGGIVLIVLGVVFLLNNLNIVSFHHLIHHYWPVIFILIGLSIIFKANKAPVDESHGAFVADDFATTGAKIYESRTFGDVRIKATGTPFEGGFAQVVFGEIYLDIPPLELAKGKNILQVNTTFGSIKVKIEEKMPVKIIASNLAGTINVMGVNKEGWNERVLYQSDDFENAEAKLEIVCSTTFGEILVL